MNSPTETYSHYSYPLVSWGPTLMGAAVAIVISVMLNLLGASLGFATAAMGQSAHAAATGGMIGLAWVVVSNLIALYFGAWVAARSTSNPDHHSGTLQGVGVWAITSLVVLFLAGSAISGTASTLAQSASNASAPAIAQQTDNGTDAQTQAQNAIDNAQASANRNQAELRDDAVKAAKATSAATFGTFLAMLLGLLASVIGARSGAKHPEWIDRPRHTYGSDRSLTSNSTGTGNNYRTAA